LVAELSQAKSDTLRSYLNNGELYIFETMMEWANDSKVVRQHAHKFSWLNFALVVFFLTKLQNTAPAEAFCAQTIAQLLSIYIMQSKKHILIQALKEHNLDPQKLLTLPQLRLVAMKRQTYFLRSS
jgi:hypothetical protein